MDRGEAEAEEARQTRVRGPSILTTEIEHELMRTALRNACDTYAEGRTEDPHGCLARESSESLAARGRRFPSRNVNENLSTVLVLSRRTHRAEGARQPVRGTVKSNAVDRVQARFDAKDLSEEMFKGDGESVTQTLVDAMQVGRGEKPMMEKSSKCLHQSGSEAEDAAQRIECLKQTRACVLREKLCRKVVRESITLSQPDEQVVSNQAKKRDDGHGERSRVKGKKCDGPLKLVGETVGFMDLYHEIVELESRRATIVCPDRAGEKDEVIVSGATGIEFSQLLWKLTKDDQRQRDMFTVVMSVPWDTSALIVEWMTSNRRRHITEYPLKRCDEASGGIWMIYHEVRRRARGGLGLPMSRNEDKAAKKEAGNCELHEIQGRTDKYNVSDVIHTWKLDSKCVIAEGN